MSGPAIHTLLAEALGSHFRDEGCSAARAQVEPLEKHVNFRNFGSMGPDFLLFHFGPPPLVRLLIDAVELLEALEKTITDAIPFFDEIKVLKDNLERQVQAGLDTFQTTQDLQQMISDLRHTWAAFQSLMVAAGSDFVTDQVDFFNLLPNVIQDGVPDTEWGPFDVLHYRKTGQFASKLLELSASDPELHAYSIGYLSHYAADIVGHPYVNMLVRGPFREHGQRHKVVENFQDVWAIEQFKQQEFTRSRMHLGVAFPGDQLPAKLSRLLADAYGTVYRGELDDLSSPQQIDAAYRFWYYWYKLTTETADIPPRLPRLQFPISSTIQDAWEDFKRDVLSNFRGGGSLRGGDFSAGGLLNFFNRIGRAIMSSLYLGAAALDWLLSRGTHIAKEVLHYFLSKIYDELYAAYLHFREAVALKGLLFPLTQTTRRGLALHFTDPTLPDSVGRFVTAADPYPVRALGANPPLGDEGHLIYPPNVLEGPAALVAPRSYLTEPATFYMNGPLRTDPNLLDQLRRANSPGADSADVQRLERAVADLSLGNALTLTAQLYCDWSEKKENAIPDLNLDADRGLGFPTWEVTKANGASQPVPAQGDVPVTLTADETA